MNRPFGQDISTELMKRLVAAIADQIRNPVASIQAAMQVFNDQLARCNHGKDCGVADIQSTMHQLISRVKRLDRYVGELSQFAIPAVVRRRQFNLTSMIYDTVSEVRKETNGQVNFIYQPTSGDADCLGDPDLLGTALRACIFNGVEAVDPAVKPELTLSWQCEDQEAWLEIRDNGPGFAAEVLASPIEPFHSTKEAGTGIGLSLAERNVKAHGGDVSLANNSGGGAIVRIWFPFSERRPASATKSNGGH